MIKQRGTVYRKELEMQAKHCNLSATEKARINIMHTIENVKKISLIFFIITGLAHIVSGLMISNGYLIETSKLINQILDIPFIMTGILYGFSSLRLNLASDEKKHTILDATLISIAVIILVAVIAINLFIPDL